MNYKQILASKSHNESYLAEYIEFIDSRVNKVCEGYTENHHICPKAPDLFPEFANLKKFPWNSIKLSYEDHIKAHTLLFNAFGEYYNSVIHACALMSFNEEARILQNNLTSIRNAHTITVFDTRSNKWTSITSNEFYENRDLYKTTADDHLSVIEILSGKSKRIHKTDYDPSIHKTKTSGMVVCTIKATNISGLVSIEEYRLNRHLYKHPNEGLIRSESTKQKLSDFYSGKTHAFNINTKRIVVITSEEFYANKGTLYVSTSSKEYINKWKNYDKNV